MSELNTEHFLQCIKTLEASLERLKKSSPNSIDYDVFRCATIKSFELVLELSGKLIRKVLKTYATNPKEIDEFTFKEVFRHATKHGLLGTEEVERWFSYRDNRNNTAHDYGKSFAEETLTLLPKFIIDAQALQKKIQIKFGAKHA